MKLCRVLRCFQWKPPCPWGTPLRMKIIFGVIKLGTPFCLYPSGMKACSRWLSVATPPVARIEEMHPEGVPEKLITWRWHPFRVRIPIVSVIRWYRSFLTQPPATCCDASGVKNGQNRLPFYSIENSEEPGIIYHLSTVWIHIPHTLRHKNPIHSMTPLRWQGWPRD